MKFIFILGALSIILYACHQGNKHSPQIDYSGYSEKNFFLTGMNKDLEQKDTLAILSIKIPDQLDTFYQWQDFTDYYDGQFTKYRFADKRYIQYPESGFSYSIQPDSVYQLTVWHKRRKEVPDSIDLKSISENEMKKYAYSVLLRTSMVMDSIDQMRLEYRVINNRAFFIDIYKTPAGYLTWKPSLFLVGLTNLKDRSVYFVGECCGKDTVGFIDEIYKSLLSIKIQEK